MTFRYSEISIFRYNEISIFSILRIAVCKVIIFFRKKQGEKAMKSWFDTILVSVWHKITKKGEHFFVPTLNIGNENVSLK